MKKNGVWYVKNPCKNGERIVMVVLVSAVGTAAVAALENAQI